ncbi:MAG: sensor histidine kinase, partial [Kangiellaceae bacterium]
SILIYTMTLKPIKISLSEWGAIGAWFAVFVITLMAMSNGGWENRVGIYQVIGLFLLYFICMILVINETLAVANEKLRLFSFILQLISACLINFYVSFNSLAILTIIWASILPSFVQLKNSIIITSLVVVLWYALHWYLWRDNNIYFSALLFFTFHLFAISMTHNAVAAERAKEKAEKLNNELTAAQLLLGEASRQNERTRIARDLHDLLGHHLTALLINLQVAEHTSEGQAKENISQCRALAKLLMSDVREAVTSLRENQSLNFKFMLDKMMSAVPKLEFKVDLQYEFELDDIEIVEQLLSCIQEAITNCLKHSQATLFKLSINKNNNQLVVNFTDNGHCEKLPIKGHGLTGMEERINLLNGSVEFSLDSGHFNILIHIPVESK